MERTFIMIKPDFLNNARGNEYLIALLEKYKIQCLKEREYVFRKVNVLDFWPKYSRSKISFYLISKYLVDHSVSILYVEGKNIFWKLKKIKKLVRKNYAEGDLANCIHTPDDAMESEKQIASLTTISNGNDGIPPFEPVNLVTEDVIEAVDDLFFKAKKSGWRHLEKTFEDDSPYVLYLLDDTKNSIDFIIKSLSDVFESLSLSSLLSIVISATANGRARLMAGKDDIKLKKIQNHFDLLGITTLLINNRSK